MQRARTQKIKQQLLGVQRAKKPSRTPDWACRRPHAPEIAYPNPSFGKPAEGFAHFRSPQQDRGRPRRTPRHSGSPLRGLSRIGNLGGKLPIRGRPRDPRGGLGRWGEFLARQYLRLTGSRILASNLRTPHGEVDVVARERGSGVLVLIEVKTRRDRRPIELSERQKRRIARAAHWIQQCRSERWNAGVRIDLVEIRWPRRWWPWPNPFPQLRRFRGAWGDGEREFYGRR